MQYQHTLSTLRSQKLKKKHQNTTLYLQQNQSYTMIKSLIRKLFLSNENRNTVINDLKSNPNFKTKEEMEKKGTTSTQTETKLEKGKTQSIFLPKMGNQRGFILTKWYVKPGDIVKSGDVICEIENKKITMEFETFYSGKIINTCRLNQKLTNGTEIVKIEGI